jgi:hypothetical protein
MIFFHSWSPSAAEGGNSPTGDLHLVSPQLTHCDRDFGGAEVQAGNQFIHHVMTLFDMAQSTPFSLMNGYVPCQTRATGRQSALMVKGLIFRGLPHLGQAISIPRAASGISNQRRQWGQPRAWELCHR